MTTTPPRLRVPGDPVAAAELCLAARLPGGDPGRLRAGSARAATFAAELRRLGAALGSPVGMAPWRGVAQREFAAVLARDTPRLAATADRYDAYAGALARYAGVLAGAAGELAGLRRELGWRLDAARAARAALVLTPEPRTPPPPPMPPVPPGPDEAADPAAVARRRADAAAGELWPWVARFRAAHDAWLDALDVSVAAIRAAHAHDPTRDLHGWAAFQHNTATLGRWAMPLTQLALQPSLRGLSDTLDTLATELTVLGIGLCFVFPPAGAAALTAATVLSAAKLGTDLTRQHHGEPVSNTDLALTALGAIPLGGRALKTGEHLAEALPRVAETLGTRQLGRAAPAITGIEGDGFVMLGPNTITRKINWRPNAADPNWGLTRRHVQKHLFGRSEYSLNHVDPGGTPEKWLGHIQDLAGRPTTKVWSNGVEEVMGRFARADGAGTMKLGIRVFRYQDGTFDLVTILTGQ